MVKAGVKIEEAVGKNQIYGVRSVTVMPAKANGCHGFHLPPSHTSLLISRRAIVLFLPLNSWSNFKTGDMFTGNPGRGDSPGISADPFSRDFSFRLTFCTTNRQSKTSLTSFFKGDAAP
jgi:hypothetical protein